MKTSTLKKAVLTNKGLWTTTIEWATIHSDEGKPAEFGKTCIMLMQKYYRNKEKSYTVIEKYNHEEFDKAYDRFHELLKKWL